MDNLPHLRFPLSDRSYVSIIKKEIKKVAENIGFKDNRLAEIEIIVAEITSNIIKHSIDGYLLVKHFSHNNSQGIEILSIDNGPGMINPNQMLKDGVSTTKTLGQGLGAIKRLSDDFDIYSAQQWGTILLSRVYIKGKGNTSANDSFIAHSLMVPKKGETACGDGFKLILKNQWLKILAFDGLGHGPEAQKANEAAIQSFLNSEQQEPADALKVMNREIRNTRGGVGMIGSIDAKAKSFTYCGVGNISARLLCEGKLKNCISYNGIVGHTFPNTLHSNTVPFNVGDWLVICSDGLTARWDAPLLVNFQRYDPAIISAYMFKEYSRGNDDSLIIIIKVKAT